jgi:hypothetical protein
MQEGEDHGEGDDDMFENYCRGDKLILFIHLAYGRQPPRFCMRDLELTQQCDVGIEQRSAPVNVSSRDKDAKGKKRTIHDLTQDDLESIMGERALTTEELAAIVASTERDNAMKHFYLLEARAKQIEIIRSLLLDQSLGDARLETLRERLIELSTALF